MPPDRQALLWDALRASDLILEFSAGKSFEEYEADVQLRSAVERQFEIIGEALNRFRGSTPRLRGRSTISRASWRSATFSSTDTPA
jgi:uncharacterized protein with HEPN domain